MALDRRDFLKNTVAASGGLVIALSLPGCGRSEKKVADAGGAPQTVEANAWLRIGTDNTITFICDRAEMGQGVYTALPMLLAEELGVDLDDVRIEFAPPGGQYTNNLLGTQITGGSTSVRDAWPKLRKAGAQARMMLFAAAADEWGGSTRGMRVENASVVSPRGKKLKFGELAAAAAKMPVPENVTLTPTGKQRLIGKSVKRLDTPMKIDGTCPFGIDTRLPEMLYAALAQSPVLGGKVRSFDADSVKSMPGVKEVVETSTGVAVVADSWWHARKARDALKVQWDAGANGAVNDASIQSGLQRAASKEGRVARQDGDANAAITAASRDGGRVIKADFQLPLLAHATLEPQNCTADVRADGCDLYVPTQVPLAAQATAAKAAGLDASRVRVHTTFLGGGFGRRIETDFIPAAVEASKAVGKPVKVVWTREDDMTHDTYRPPAFDTVTAAVDKDGRLTAWKLHLVGPSVTARLFPSVVEKDIDPFAVEAATNFPYDVPNVTVDYLQHEVGVDVGYWRSVSHALNAFVTESFMDELAHTVKRDPVEFRMGLLEKQPRFREVLRLATREGAYGYPKRGHHQGVAVMEGYGTYMAQVAEISLDGGKVQVHKVTCAVDCGRVVNPDIVMAQVESATIFGLTAALWGEINLQGGRVQQTNFDTYRLLRMNEMPKIDTFIIDSTAEPGGIGEPATALIAPAVCNAIYMGTGRRLHSLPIARHRLA